MVLSAALFPTLVCGVAFLINFIAIYYHASRAIPFLTMVSNGAIFHLDLTKLMFIETESLFLGLNSTVMNDHWSCIRQFKVLPKRNLKTKLRLYQLKPMNSAILVQCSNQLSCEATTGRAGHFSVGPLMPLTSVYNKY